MTNIKERNNDEHKTTNKSTTISHRQALLRNIGNVLECTIVVALLSRITLLLKGLRKLKLSRRLIGIF